MTPYASGYYSSYNGGYMAQQYAAPYYYSYPYAGIPTPYMNVNTGLYNSPYPGVYSYPYASPYASPYLSPYPSGYPYTTEGIFSTQANPATDGAVCDSSCATCSGPGNDQCLTCTAGTFPQRIEGKSTFVCIKPNSRV